MREIETARTKMKRERESEGRERERERERKECRDWEGGRRLREVGAYDELKKKKWISALHAQILAFFSISFRLLNPNHTCIDEVLQPSSLSIERISRRLSKKSKNISKSTS